MCEIIFVYDHILATFKVWRKEKRHQAMALASGRNASHVLIVFS